MSTGLETWNTNLLDIGTLYPFPGSEGLLVLIGVATWLLWHILQIRAENRVYEEEDQRYSDPKQLEAAMRFSAAETLLETAKAHADGLKK